MVGKEKAMAKLSGKAGAEGREAPAPQPTLFSTSVAHSQSPDPEALFFWKQVPGGKEIRLQALHQLPPVPEGSEWPTGRG